MAKATSRIKTEKGKYIEVGQDVPDEIAKANPHAVERSMKRSIDPKNPQSYAGVQAAQESIVTRPDHPDRPTSIEGEDSFKVTSGGALGKAAGGDANKVIDPKTGKKVDASTAKTENGTAPNKAQVPAAKQGGSEKA